MRFLRERTHTDQTPIRSDKLPFAALIRNCKHGVLCVPGYPFIHSPFTSSSSRLLHCFYITFTQFSQRVTMQYYNEEKMHNLRLRIEKEVLNWPNVTTRKMYGCPCYKNKQKLFAFLVTSGVVLTKVSDHDKTELSEEFEIKPFQSGKRTMNKWPQIRVDETTDLERVIAAIKNSYSQSETP